MSSLRDIRNRIRSVENIKKITQAMERVAAVHLRRAQKKAEQSAPYANKLKEILEKLASLHLDNPLFHQREVKKTALVIVSADKGLAGSYNSNLFQESDRFLKKYTPENLELILVGKKAVEYYRKKDWQIHLKIEDWGGKIALDQIKSFSSELVDLFVNGTFDEIWIIYTHYISIMKRSVATEKFLNIEKKQTLSRPLNYIWEPCPHEILAEILPRYCLTQMIRILDEAYASELAARIVAMQAASKNSSEMIESLTLTKNKIRQRDITREMIEISSGGIE